MTIIYLSEQARQYQQKRLDEIRRDMEAQLAKESTPLQPQKINFLPIVLPPPGTSEHAVMYRGDVPSED